MRVLLSFAFFAATATAASPPTVILNTYAGTSFGSMSEYLYAKGSADNWGTDLTITNQGQTANVSFWDTDGDRFVLLTRLGPRPLRCVLMVDSQQLGEYPPTVTVFQQAGLTCHVHQEKVEELYRYTVSTDVDSTGVHACTWGGKWGPHGGTKCAPCKPDSEFSSCKLTPVEAPNPKECLAKMAEFCTDAEKEGETRCKQCLHQHFTDLRPLCEGTGSGNKFCGGGNDFEAEAPDPKACLAKMAQFCSDVVKAGETRCEECLHQHFTELRPLCEGTGSGRKFCGGSVDAQAELIV